MTIGLSIYAAAISWQSWVDEKADFIKTLNTITELEAKSVDSYFTHLENDLTILAAELPQDTGKTDLAKAFVMVKRFKENHPELFNVTLVRPNGDILLTARNPPGTIHATLANEVSFTAFIEELKQGTVLSIGQPLIAVVSKTVIVPVRLALKDLQGNVSLIVSANLPHEYLRSFWMEAPITDLASIGLIRDNGYLLSRFPVPSNTSLEEIYGRPRTGALINHLRQQGYPERGFVEGPSSLDGTNFLTAFRRLPHYPVTVFVALPLSQVRQAWRERISGTYIAILLLLVGSLAAYRYAHRRQCGWDVEQARLEAEKAESNRELIQSESRFRALFSQNHAVILQVAPMSGAIVNANIAASNFYGWSREQLCRMNITDINQLNPDEIAQERQAALYEQRNYFVFPHRLASGEIKTVEVYSTPIELDDGPVLVSIIHDITERNLATAKIEALMKEQTTILENSLVGIVTVQNRRIIWANTAFAAMLGYAKEELAGMPTQQNYPSEAAYLALGQAAYPVLATGQVFRTSAEHVRKDGQHIWVDMAGSMLDAEQGISLWGFIDNTARIQSETQLREAQAIAHVGSWEVKHIAHTVSWSDEMFRIYEVDPATPPTPDSCWATVHPEDQAMTEWVFKNAIQSKSKIDIRQRVVVSSEEARYVHVIGATSYDKDGAPVRSSGTAQDITFSVLQELAIHESEERFRTIADYTYDWEYWQGVNGTIEYISPACLRVSGYSATEFQLDPKLLEKIIHPDDAHQFADHLANEADKDEASITFRIIRKDGGVRWIAHGCRAVSGKNGVPCGRRANNRDITELKDAEQLARQLAFYDVLTGLPNRRMLLSRLDQGLSQATRFSRALAVMFLDLDHFKEINDTFGHEAGDQLLIEVAKRLVTCVRAGDTVARSGGDEFIIVLPEIANSTDATVVAEKILEVLKMPIAFKDTLLDVTVSIGVAVHPVSGDNTANELLTKADTAMYAAKKAGRNGYKLFGIGI